MKAICKKAIALGATVATVAMIAAGPALADGKPNIREQWRLTFDEKIKGKKVAWVPVWMGVLESEWTAVMKDQFSRYGIELTTRDPNFNNDVALQAVTSLINEKPDVLIVQNNSTTLLASELKRAMQEGIYVVQVNMASNTLSDAYVGVDWVDIGRQIATEVVKDCGGGKSSGKVAMIQGEATAAGSVDQLKGAMEVFNADPSIKVVMSQPASWDANKANQLATTAIQQNPDLCAIYGYWGPMTAGAAQAVKNAGKSGQIKVYASSDGQQGDCDQLTQGLFSRALSYRADIQGQAIVNAVLSLLQSDNAPGSKSSFYFSNQYWMNGPDEARYCYADPTK